MSGKFGVSFSWRRAVGLSALKGRISRIIGVPLTESGRERKAGQFLLGKFGCLLVILAGVGVTVIVLKVMSWFK